MTLVTMDWNLGWVQFAYLLMVIIKDIRSTRTVGENFDAMVMIDTYPWIANVLPASAAVVQLLILYVGGCFGHAFNWVLVFLIAHEVLEALSFYNGNFVEKLKEALMNPEPHKSTPDKAFYRRVSKLVFLFLAGFFTHSLPIPLF